MQLVSSLVERPVVGVAFALTAAILVGNLLALGYWARAEAAARDGSAVWTFAYLCSGFGLVHYVWVRHVRGDWEPRTEPADRRERLVTAYSLAAFLAMVATLVVSPPDPVTQVLALPPLFAGSVVLSSLFVTRNATRGPGETST